MDPIARGVLDLALRHDFSDASIAQLIGRSDHEVAQLREQTMAEVAHDLGYGGDDAYARTRDELLTVPADLWIGANRRPPDPEPAAEPEAQPEIEIEPDPEPEPEPELEPEPQPPEPRGAGETVAPTRVEAEPQRSSRLLLVALALAGALVVVLFLSRSGDGQPSGETTAAETVAEPAPAPADEPEPPSTPEPEPAPAPDPEPDPSRAPQSPPEDAIALQALPGAPTGGTVSVSVSERDGASVARVDLDGLRKPAGVYKLWLFTSLITSKALGSTNSGDGVITARLPEDAETYAFFDLSLEQSAGDRLHSGRSVMRVSTAAVLQPGD